MLKPATIGLKLNCFDSDKDNTNMKIWFVKDPWYEVQIPEIINNFSTIPTNTNFIQKIHKELLKNKFLLYNEITLYHKELIIKLRNIVSYSKKKKKKSFNFHKNTFFYISISLLFFSKPVFLATLQGILKNILLFITFWIFSKLQLWRQEEKSTTSTVVLQ